MVKGRFKIGNERSIVVDLPERAEEWTLAKFIDFKVILDEIVSGEENAFLLMSKAVEKVTGVSVNDILVSQLGEDFTPGKEEHEGLSAIFGFLKTSALSHKGVLRGGSEFSVTYKGKEFHIPHSKSVTLVSGEVPQRGLSVFEAVECLEIIRLTSDKIKKEGDPKGNIWYSRYIKMLALLLEEKGDEFLTDQALRERKIAQREIFFQDIDLRTALDVDFFLLTLLIHSKQTHKIAGSLNQAVFEMTVQTLRHNAALMKSVKGYLKKRLKK